MNSIYKKIYYELNLESIIFVHSINSGALSVLLFKKTKVEIMSQEIGSSTLHYALDLI